MEIRVLGPVALVDGGADVPLGGPRQQSVLAVLTALAGETVSTDRLIDEIWGEDPPPAAKNSLQSMVSNLRRIVATDGAISLDRTGPGYVLRCPGDRVDAQVFVAAVDRARSRLTEDPLAAESDLSGALGLWNGGAYAGVSDDIPVLQAERVRLEELRVRAIGYRIEASLALGRHGEVVGELDTLVAAHPLNEEFARLQMLALYRSGRQSEALRAMSRLRRTLGDELGIDPSPDLRELEQRILDQDPALGTVGDPAARRTDLPNPYKGLRPFGEADARDFFGRDAMVTEIVDRIDRAGPGGFTAVVGASGSGKSSLVSAGVVPRLRSGAIDGSDAWVVCSMYPGSRPMEELEAAVLSAAPDASVAVIELLAAEDGLRRAARLLAGDDGQLLLVVDQAEELFTLAGADQRERFIDTMTGALDDERARVRVVFTLRADYLSAPLADPRLADLLRAGTLLVPPMSPAEVEEAIVGPAERVGATVDPRLVAVAVGEVEGHPGALPMLQHALTETFERRTSDRLTREDYEAVGGVTTALANTADRVLGALGDAGRSAARLVLLRLVTPGEASADTRRRVLVSEVRDSGPDAEGVSTILGAFAATRLLVFDVDPISGEATVEVSHEALLSEWTVFRTWIAEAREDLRMEQRLRALAADWQANGRGEGFLLRGNNLARFLGWRGGSSIPLESALAAYLDASVGQEREAERLRVRRRRRVVSVLAGATIVSVLLAVLAFTRSVQAGREARLADARALAGQSIATLDEDAELAVILALEAMELEPGSDSVGALHAAVARHRLVATYPAGGFAAAWVDPDRIATLQADGSVAIVDLRTATTTRSFGPVGGVHPTPGVVKPMFAVSADGLLLAIALPDGGVEMWEVETGVRRWRFDVGDLIDPGVFEDLDYSPPRITGKRASISWHPSEPLVAIRASIEGPSSTPETLYRDLAVGGIYDAGGTRVFSFKDPCICYEYVEFDQLGRLWANLESYTALPDPGFTPYVPAGDTWVADDSLKFEVAGSRGLSAGRFGIVNIYADDARIYSPGDVRGASFVAHQRPINDVDMGPGGRVVTGGEDGQARVWSSDTGDEQMVLSGHDGAIMGVGFRPDATGSLVLTVATDGEARLWKAGLVDVAEVAGMETTGGSVHSALFGGDSDDVVILRGGALDVAENPLKEARGIFRGALELGAFSSTDTTILDPSALLAGAVDDATGLIAAVPGFTPVAVQAVVLVSPSLDVTLLRTKEGMPTAVAFDSEGSRLGVAGCREATSRPDRCLGSGFAAVYAVSAGNVAPEPLATVDLGPTAPLSIAFAGDTVLVLGVLEPFSAAGADVFAWRGSEVRSWEVPGDATVLAAGGDRVVVGDAGGSLLWYDLDGTLVADQPGHTGGVTSVVFDGDRVASAGSDGRVRLWGVDATERYTIWPGEIPVVSLDVREDDLLLLRDDAVVFSLTLDVDRLVEIARSRVDRDLTPAECLRFPGAPSCA
ncbi:MAG TPA: BTAD domain-containing putative transcriptional regulator [Acidimicrobiia bacterium]|nr:BTAD domain-containing putative transcriptional regulator [Acidimicrobiia bacterium]